MNELECIRAFVKVAEVGSFAEVARQSGTVKSVISKRVNQLEEHLELQLFQRSTRRLSITDGGADFYERAVHILSALEQAKEAVSSVEWGLTGTFRVSCVSSFTSAYLSHDLCEFQRLHPELKIDLEQHDRFCDPVQEGFDVCLQPAIDKIGPLERVNLLPLRRVIVATPSYIKKYGEPRNPKALINHRFAHNNHISPDCVIPFMENNSPQKVTVSPDIVSNTIWMLKAALMRGEHLALMPAFFIEEELVSGKLVAVLPKLEVNCVQLSAYYRRSSFVPMKVRIFINFLRQRYGATPPWEQRIIQHCPELAKVLSLPCP